MSSNLLSLFHSETQLAFLSGVLDSAELVRRIIVRISAASSSVWQLLLKISVSSGTWCFPSKTKSFTFLGIAFRYPAVNFPFRTRSANEKFPLISRDVPPSRGLWNNIIYSQICLWLNNAPLPSPIPLSSLWEWKHLFFILFESADSFRQISVRFLQW